MKSKKMFAAFAVAAAAALAVFCFALFSGKENPGTTVKIETDRTEYHVGDTVTCTVTLEPVTDLVGLKFMLALPEGLTYVDGSGKAPEGLREAMNAVKAEFTEKSKIFIFLGDSAYENEEPTVLMTMQCIVNEKAAASQNIGSVPDELECFNLDNEDIKCSVTEAVVSVVDSGTQG